MNMIGNLFNKNCICRATESHGTAKEITSMIISTMISNNHNANKLQEIINKAKTINSYQNMSSNIGRSSSFQDRKSSMIGIKRMI